MRYAVANLSVLLVLLGSAIYAVASFANPPAWTYFLIVPVAFFILGYLEERLLSGPVNQLVKSFNRERKP